MTRAYYRNQIKQLEQDFYRMGKESADMLTRSLVALVEKDTDLARRVMTQSDAMEDREIELEEKCIVLLATQQPMAGDLRFISTVLKVLSDCRRFSRLAWDIGAITLKIGEEPLLQEIDEIIDMHAKVDAMVRDSFQAFVTRDVALAKSMGARDDAVDAQYDRIRRELIDEMIGDPACVDIASHLSFVARYLERSADHACAIASHAVYMTTGERVKIR